MRRVAATDRFHYDDDNSQVILVSRALAVRRPKGPPDLRKARVEQVHGRAWVRTPEICIPARHCITMCAKWLIPRPPHLRNCTPGAAIKSGTTGKWCGEECRPSPRQLHGKCQGAQKQF